MEISATISCAILVYFNVSIRIDTLFLLNKLNQSITHKRTVCMHACMIRSIHNGRLIICSESNERTSGSVLDLFWIT